MIRRPLNERFAEKVRAGIKTTTIRPSCWPVGKPIMLYTWAGAPYRSPQIEVAPVVVESVNQVVIGRTDDGAGVFYVEHPSDVRLSLWEGEGFPSREAMDEWFRPLVKPGDPLTQWIMRFRLLDVPHE